ncbi:ATP-binding protein [Gallaecimonas sp. GXIMD4217]|uniref:ATP-binding protein n=1 Tax=Gallaecimonas sp. GXIMD4217 TaxID=3131927 RepID=UPI00311AEAD2
MPSLNRIILINTHLKGVVELALDDHTNICGTNASGKTTLQRLVPVFYGEYPSRVVPSTRDSFERWYLPTEQSYIIYEYLRLDGQLAQVVLASAGDGKGVNYRFIGKGFELDDFIKRRQGDSISFLAMAELGRELKRAGVNHTKLLNTSQFKAIIQNDRSLLGTNGNRSELRTWARQFSLCEPEHSLRHIEKLAKAVHSKEGKMETIKSMIAAILEEDGVTPPASRLNPQRVEAWIRESQLIQGFNAIRPEFDKLEQEFEELKACELRLSGLMQGYKADEPIQWQQLETSNNRIEELGFRKNQLENSWKEQRDELNQELSAARGDLAKVEEDLDQLEEQHQAFMEADIEQAKADLELLPAWRDDRDNLQARHKLQTEKHQDVEAAYNERRHKVSEQLAQVLDELRAQQDQLQEQRDAKRQQQSQELAELEQSFNQRRQQGIDDFKDKRYQLKLELSQLQAQLDGANYSDEERQALLIVDERIHLADEAAEAARAKLEQLQHQERQLRAKRDDANDILRQAGRRVSERQAQLEDIKQILYPGHHSLLEFLRKERPQWEATLGKVIHPELLHRSDLKPSLSQEGADALFGIQLDLAALDTPDYAQSEQELRQRLDRAEEAVLEAQNLQEEAEAQLVAAGEALDELNRQLTFARTEQKNRHEDLRRLFEEKKAQQDKINAALAERKRKGQQQLSQLDNRLKQLDSDHQLWLDELKEQALEARMEKTAYWQEVVGAIEDQLSQLRASIEDRRAKAREEHKACDSWYRQELKSRGVDEAEILKLKQQIRDLEGRIAKAEQRRAEVLRFDDWYQHNWLQRKPRLQAQNTELKALVAKLDQQLKDATASHKQQRNALEDGIQQARQAKVQAEEFLAKIKSLLKKLGELKLPRDGVEAMGGLAERLALGEELLLGRDQHLASVKAYVDRFDGVIAGQAGSSLSETWERSREQCSLINDKGIRLLDYRKLVPELKQLLNVMVPQSITALREQGRIFGDDLNKYYDVLADIDRRIASQSARITREVGEELFLDGVSDSAVRIRSKISELEFWPELQAFIKAYKDWKAEGFSELPSEDYTSAMRRALDIIGRSALSGGIAGLLEIELRLREGNSDLVIRTDRQLGESSSHGMAYLILCKFLLAFTRLLRGRARVTIHWPIDELGTLHYNNVKKIFDACSNNDIRVLGAFPNPDSEVLDLFANRYIVNKQTRQLQVVKPKLDPIAEKLKQKQRQREAV